MNKDDYLELELLELEELENLETNKSGSTSSTIIWNEWYHLTNPKIQYFLNGKEKAPRFYYEVSPIMSKENKKWFQINSHNFDDIKYGFFPIPYIFNYDKKAQLGECNLISSIILNGLLINEKMSYTKVWGLPENTAICSIVDDRNILELDLSRKSINYNHEIFDEINIEIWKWQIASILCCNIPQIRNKRRDKRQKLHEYIIEGDYPDGILIKEDCFSFWHPYFLKKLNIDQIYVIKEPLTVNSQNVSIQKHITDSEYPLLTYKKYSFIEYFDKMFKYKYNRIIKSDHVFYLIKPDINNYKFNERFVTFIDDMFSDVEDLWIPYDFNLRQQKFKKAFNMLSRYSINGRLELA